MAEADIYINTADEEAYKPDTLALSKLLVDVNDSYGAYAFVNKTYKVILHEIGHAVGLDHIPVSGNVMSRDFGAGGLDQWSAPIAIELFRASDPKQDNKFVDPHSRIFPYMIVREENLDLLERVDFFTRHAKLGEQETTGHCQRKVARTEFSTDDRELGHPELTPLGERGGAVELEIVS